MSHGDRDPFRDGVSRRTFIKGRAPLRSSGRLPLRHRPAAARSRPSHRRTPGSSTCHLLRRRTARSTITSATRRRCRLPASGRPGLLAAGWDGGARPVRVHEPPDARPAHSWAPCTSSGTAARWTASSRTRRDRRRRRATTRPPSCHSTTACSTTSTLCGNYFCSLLGPTWPNRFYFAAGTSGGITTNGIWGYGVFDYPIILDLLDAAGVTLEGLQHRLGQRPLRQHDNVFVFWKKYAHDKRTHGSRATTSRPRAGPLPQVSWIIPSFARGRDEHPPADVSVGMGIQEDLITALRESPLWEQLRVSCSPTTSTAATSTTCAPPQLDAFGLGIRVPMWVISPYAKRGPSEPHRVRHASTLKFLERLFGLPTLASVNHRSTRGRRRRQLRGREGAAPRAAARRAR